MITVHRVSLKHTHTHKIHHNMLPEGRRDTGAAAKPADLPEGLSIHHSIHQTLSQSHDKNMKNTAAAKEKYGNVALSYLIF